MSNKKRAPAGDRRDGDVETLTGNLALPLDYTTTESPCQTLTIGRALRLRDAIIALERRLAEARAAFEADIVEVLKNGGGR